MKINRVPGNDVLRSVRRVQIDDGKWHDVADSSFYVQRYEGKRPDRPLPVYVADWTEPNGTKRSADVEKIRALEGADGKPIHLT